MRLGAQCHATSEPVYPGSSPRSSRGTLPWRWRWRGTPPIPWPLLPGLGLGLFPREKPLAGSSAPPCPAWVCPPRTWLWYPKGKVTGCVSRPSLPARHDRLPVEAAGLQHKQISCRASQGPRGPRLWPQLSSSDSEMPPVPGQPSSLLRTAVIKAEGDVAEDETGCRHAWEGDSVGVAVHPAWALRGPHSWFQAQASGQATVPRMAHSRGLLGLDPTWDHVSNFGPGEVADHALLAQGRGLGIGRLGGRSGRVPV